MKTLSSVKHAYREYLNQRHGCDVYTEFKRILYSCEDSLVQYLNNEVLQSLAGSLPRRPRVCDVGGGDGYRIARMADYCHAKFDCTFCVDFIEQSGEFCDRYRKRIESGAYSASVFHSLFETAPVESAAYDLVFLIHSIFAFESRDAVRKVLSLPRAGGRIVVVSNDESSFLGGLKRILDVDFDDRRYEINELEETLRAAGVGYERRRVLTRWAVSEADWQVRMDVMLEWLSLGAYGSLAASAKHDVETYVMANSQPLEGRRIFCEEEVVLIIGPTVAQ